MVLRPGSVLAIATMVASSICAPPAYGASPTAEHPPYLLTAGYFDSVLSGDVGGIWTGSENLAPGTDVALVLGPTGISQPSDQYLQAAYNLYLGHSGLYQGSSENVYSLFTPEESGNTEIGLAADLADVKIAVMPLLENGVHVTLFGYSQSTAAISLFLNQLDPEYADQVTYVFVGNSAAPGGLLNNIYESLPDWAQKIVIENLDAWGLGGAVLNIGDGSATVLPPDSPFSGAVYSLASGGTGTPYPDGYALWNADSFASGGQWWEQLMGMFSTHLLYLGLTPTDVDSAVGTVDGSVTNYLLDPDQSFLELLTQSAAGAGWIPESLAEALVSIGL